MLRRAPALRHAGVVFIRKTATRARARSGATPRSDWWSRSAPAPIRNCEPQ